MGSKQSRCEKEEKSIQPAPIPDASDATVQIILRNINLSQPEATPQREQTTTTRFQTTFKILEFFFWTMSSLLGMFGGGFTIYSLTMQHLYPNPNDVQQINDCDHFK